MTDLERVRKGVQSILEELHYNHGCDPRCEKDNHVLDIIDAHLKEDAERERTWRHNVTDSAHLRKRLEGLTKAVGEMEPGQREFCLASIDEWLDYMNGLRAELTELREAVKDALPVVEYVSRGRRFVDVEPYPDARARRVNASLRQLIA